MPNDIKVAKVFEPIFTSDLKDFILESGRDAGKSKTVYILSGIQAAQKPDEDIVIARASYGSIGDSSYNEMVEVLDSVDAFNDKFIFRKSPLRIIRKGSKSTIYFMGVGGSTDRTKGIKPLHKVGLLIIEEAQEIKTREHYDQLLASLRRRFGDECKVITVFNPPAQELHWINVWANQKRKDKDYCVIHSSYLDILEFLNDRDIKEIRKLKFENEDYYNYMYMGIPTGSNGAVYPMFRKDKHVISKQEFDYVCSVGGIKPIGCIIGGDGAVNRDATSFVPGILLSNGQCVNGPIFYHNPKEDGTVGYHQLVRDYLQKWFDNLCAEFHLGTRQEIQIAIERKVNITVLPIYMRIDSAAPDLIKECQFFLSDRADISAIKKSTIPQMVATVQSALCNDSEIIIDYGGYYDYVKDKFIKRDNNLLAEQLSMLAWDEKQTGYDPIIPNDVADAFTYKTIFWYQNIENISYFDILKANSITNKRICDILKNRNGEEI